MSQQRWAEVMRQALLAVAGVVLLTVWWVAEGSAVDVLVLVAVTAGVGWLLGVQRLWPLWRRVGLVVVGGLIALVVAATGGSDSVYQDLFLVVVVGAALVADESWGLVGGAVIAALGAMAPALYEDVDRVFVTDAVADVLVWVAVGAVVWSIERSRAGKERERSALVQRYVTVIEDERDRLANDLHDEAIQLLAAARLRLRAASNDHRSSDLDAADGLLGDGLLSLRRLILELKAPDVATGSLEDLVHAYAERLLTPANVTLDLQIALPEDLHPDVVTTAYRIIVEALSNVAKHAEATTVRVEVAVEDGGLVGRVIDDGRGLPEDVSPEPGHIGLRSMRERAEVHGGSARPRRIPAADGGGTNVSFSLPLEPPGL